MCCEKEYALEEGEKKYVMAKKKKCDCQKKIYMS